MPIHDWTRVRANRFHDFHQGWIAGLCGALNRGTLPPGYFAMIERSGRVRKPDVVALEMPSAPKSEHGIGVALQEPHVHYVRRTVAVLYAQKANRLVIRHPDGGVVAVIEIVSPGNKNNVPGYNQFVRKAVGLLHAGISLLVVDLFPPSKRDPQGIHQRIWERFEDDSFELPPDKPLTLVSYAYRDQLVAYIEPVAVGDAMPDMPVFLTPDFYVNCPLEPTCRASWEVFPEALKAPLE